MERQSSRSGIPISTESSSVNCRRHFPSRALARNEEEPLHEVRAARRSQKPKPLGVYCKPHSQGLSEYQEHRQQPIREPRQPPMVEIQKVSYGRQPSGNNLHPPHIRSPDSVRSSFVPEGTGIIDYIRGPAGRFVAPRGGSENHFLMDLTLPDCRGNNQEFTICGHVIRNPDPRSFTHGRVCPGLKRCCPILLPTITKAKAVCPHCMDPKVTKGYLNRVQDVPGGNPVMFEREPKQVVRIAGGKEDWELVEAEVEDDWEEIDAEDSKLSEKAKEIMEDNSGGFRGLFKKSSS